MSVAQQCRSTKSSTWSSRSCKPFLPASLACRSSSLRVFASISTHNAADHSLVTRRDLVLLGVTATSAHLLAPSAAQAGFKKELKKRKIPIEDYTVSDLDGLKYYDMEEGRGRAIAKGDTVVVHFDCLYRGIDAVSSRYARTLGGNRTIAEPFEFIAGQPVSGSQARKSDGGSAGGLFVGGGGPKPPPALSTAVIGMKPGGKRTILVDVPELGYIKGNQEIPAGEAFELKVEVLSTSAAAGSS